MKAKIDWSFVDFYFSDERCVSLDDPDSNFGAWNRLFLVEVVKWTRFHMQRGIQRDSIHSIDPSCISAKAIADHYERELQYLPHEDGYTVFDIIILGMGPDGHTCSLFPDHKEVEVTSQNVTYILDSPKPPKERITLTLPVLNHAKHVFFLATGKDKAPMIKSIREKKSAVPSARVQPQHGELIWFVDDQAMSEY